MMQLNAGFGNKFVRVNNRGYIVANQDIKSMGVIKGEIGGCVEHLVISQKDKPFWIAENTTVHKGFVINADVCIKEYTHIEKDVDIQTLCTIGKGSTIAEGCKIGVGAKLATRVFISSGCKLGIGCVVGTRTTIGIKVKIGDNCDIGKDCMIGHFYTITDNSSFPDATLINISTFKPGDNHEAS